MAKTIEQLAAAATLDGTELVELQQGDLSVKCTTQDIADLGGGGGGETTVTGTITGTDAVFVNIFPIPDTKPYFVTCKTIVKCTNAGAGTVVEGDAALGITYIAMVNNGGVVTTDEDFNSDDSMSSTGISAEDVDSGQLRLSITPPSETGEADSEYSYKILVSGFGL
jgi:hypothetical protein